MFFMDCLRLNILIYRFSCKNLSVIVLLRFDYKIDVNLLLVRIGLWYDLCILNLIVFYKIKWNF